MTNPRAAESVIALDPALVAFLNALPPAPPLTVGFTIVPGSPVEHRCPGCCHWSLPLALQSQPTTFGTGFVGLSYQQWIVWHLHVLLHQRAEALSS